MKTIPETRGRSKGSNTVEYDLILGKPKRFDPAKRKSITSWAKRRGVKIKTAMIDGFLWVQKIN
jgi:hypothetical protein